jgi:hypothetical protein
MAREKAPREGVYVEEPKTDVYVVMLIFSFLAMVLACVLMKFAVN